MTPAEFNSLPLEQQLKQLQPGDELHLRGGGWLPFSEYGCDSGWIYSHGLRFEIDGVWRDGGSSAMDITRVIRPTPKEQPENGEGWKIYHTEKGVRLATKPVPDIVEKLHILRHDTHDWQAKVNSVEHLFRVLLIILADHFEREAGK